MFQGLRTVIYGVTDIQKAKTWYAAALDFKPYFGEPFYVGFNVGGYELGLVPEEKPSSKPSEGVIAYWGVGNAEFERLLTLGAKEHGAARDVGGGVSMATVLDPFGNIIGLIYNPHFKIG